MPSSDESCFALAGAPACGHYGSCELANAAQECVCTVGWSQTDEISVFFLSRDERSAHLGLCNINRQLLISLWSIVLLLAVAGIILQSLQITRRKQLLRLAPLVAAMGLTAVLATYRLARFDQALLGVDVFFTFLVAQAGVLPAISLVIFTEKYLQVVTSKIAVLRANTAQTYVLFKKLNRFGILSDLISFQLFWIAALVDDHMAAQVIFRLSLGIMTLRAFALFFITRTTLARFLSDMRFIIGDLLESKDHLSMRIETEQIETGNEKIRSLHQYVRKKLIPTTARLQASTSIVNLSMGILYGFASLWPLMCYNFSYLVPVFHISWQMFNVLALLSRIGKHQKESTQPFLKEESNMGFTKFPIFSSKSKAISSKETSFQM